MAGAFALNQSRVLGGTLALNDLKNIDAWGLGGSYTADPRGRVTVQVTSFTSRTAAPPANTMAFERHLDGSGNAMVIGGRLPDQPASFSAIISISQALSLLGERTPQIGAGGELDSQM